MESINSEQLYIEGEGSDLTINVYLNNFSRNAAAFILDQYIKKFRKDKIRNIVIYFWDTYVAGDYLSFVQKNMDKFYLVKPLKGVRYMKVRFNFTKQLKSFFRTKVIRSADN